MDGFGATALVFFAALLAFNQVVIRVTNEGLQPVFFAGLRSAGAIICLGLWLYLRRGGIALRREVLPAGIAIGCVFAFQFFSLFMALDLTTVVRTGILFYTMPIWLAVAGHFLLGERITGLKLLGFLLAFGGVVVSISAGAQGGTASLAGDLFALAGALGWAAVPLICRLTPLRDDPAEIQLFWQVLVSAPILILLAPLFGDLVRDLQPIHLWGLAFQSVVVVSAGFIFWLWLLKIYPASAVASFSFLSPVFSVAFGWLLLGEEVDRSVLIALALVVAGLILINRKSRKT